MENAFSIKEENLTSLEKEIQENNHNFLEKIKNGQGIMDTVEFIKISFSKNLLEDIKFLNELSGSDNFKIRHADMIIRGLLEQVIEFIYLMKHPEMISDYMGNNLDIDKVDAQNNPIESLLYFGEKRYTGRRKSISAMAKDIKEKKSTNKLSLYDMYRILSEQCHSSYYNAIMDDVGEYETGESNNALTEEQTSYIVLIIDRFLQKYRNAKQ